MGRLKRIGAPGSESTLLISVVVGQPGRWLGVAKSIDFFGTLSCCIVSQLLSTMTFCFPNNQAVAYALVAAAVAYGANNPVSRKRVKSEVSWL